MGIFHFPPALFQTPVGSQPIHMDLHPKHTQVEKYMGINGLGAGFGSRLRISGVSQPVSFAVLSYAAGLGCAESDRQGFALELS